ncbi:MAG: hypothetical protein EPN88_15280 [Bacteroidetes bacterium]|nr:MAG: hypothetical protein EPN88_15280 [Bacteroidota bacterium]
MTGQSGIYYGRCQKVKIEMELYLKTREEWHKWLIENYSTSEEIWLIYYKKPSGKPRIPYIDAVEEALCFGWIDGKIKKINEDYFIQRFTPRRPNSRWSKYNLERVQKLINEGRMRPEGLKAYKKALEKPELTYDNRSDGDPGIPDDLMNSFAKNSLAYNNFMKFSASSRRLYIDWLNSAKKAETRPKRIQKIIGFAEKNIRPGMM